jgi:DNA-binding LytR/AlgR family response regulator
VKCIALDDEPLALQLLNSYLEKIPGLQLQGLFSNPDEALARLSAGDIELLFLDIQMPDITGLQFLKQLVDPPIVIFTTAYSEYAVEGFNLDAVDYLLKPFDFQRFEKAVGKALEYARFLKIQNDPETRPNTGAEEKPHALFVKVEYSIVRIPVEDIQYIEGFDDYIKIYAGRKPVLTLMRLKNALELLPAGRFLRVHRSFIVAIDKIETLRARKLKIAGREIPLGAAYLEDLKAYIKL